MDRAPAALTWRRIGLWGLGRSAEAGKTRSGRLTWTTTLVKGAGLQSPGACCPSPPDADEALPLRAADEAVFPVSADVPLGLTEPPPGPAATTRSAKITNARTLFGTCFLAFQRLRPARVFSCRLRCRRCNRPIISIKMIGRYQKCKDFIGDLGSCVWTGPAADPARRLTDRRQRWIPSQVPALLLLRSTECLPRYNTVAGRQTESSCSTRCARGGGSHLLHLQRVLCPGPWPQHWARAGHCRRVLSGACGQQPPTLQTDHSVVSASEADQVFGRAGADLDPDYRCPRCP